MDKTKTDEAINMNKNTSKRSCGMLGRQGVLPLVLVCYMNEKTKKNSHTLLYTRTFFQY